ncbi:MAG TPA: DeoR family transcriptional regulator [Bacillota bacterium]|nr:DeoR family transcriptional regulator [Bacillota bacterium]
MLPIERQNRIKELIKVKHHLKISELSEELGVSEMTVHRDLKPLLDEGIIMKTFGGITLVREQPLQQSRSNECIICSRTVTERLAYRLILPNNQIEMACCAHCGLMRHRQLGDQVVQAICHDFFRQTTISAPFTWFVMDTSVHVGCCQPQVLTFEVREEADKFVKGFGGSVYALDEAMEAVFEKMHGHGPGCGC